MIFGFFRTTQECTIIQTRIQINNTSNERQKKQMELIGIKEASRRLGISFWTLYAWVRTGRIPYVQLGKRKLFDPDDLEAFVEQHKVNSKKEEK